MNYSNVQVQEHDTELIDAKTVFRGSYATERPILRNATDLAGCVSLLELGARLGLIEPLRREASIDADRLATELSLPADKMRALLHAYVAAGLLVKDPVARNYSRAQEFDDYLYFSGYVLWGLSACRPFIEHTRDYLCAPTAPQSHPRDGGLVAVFSEWVGSKAFYPPVLGMIREIAPKKFVDLGCGTAKLILGVLAAVEGSTGVGIDVDPGVCRLARMNADVRGLTDRIRVVERPLQSLVEDPSPLEGAGIVHAGFVFHDLLPEETDVAIAVFRNCHKALSETGGYLILTELVPYRTNDRERKFSSLLSYFHTQFMERRLPNPSEWAGLLRAAGFQEVEFFEVDMPGARIIRARAHKGGSSMTLPEFAWENSAD